MGFVRPSDDLQKIYNPQKSSIDKFASGISDTYIVNKTYKFMGCSITSVNISMGWNGTASSMSVSLVEDLTVGDAFVFPTIPSIWAFSLPRGGVGVPLFYDNYPLKPDGFYNDNVPFYFAGICTNYSIPERDVGGRIINVSLVDPRDILSGVQCILSNYGLSHQVGAGSNLESEDSLFPLFVTENAGKLSSDINGNGNYLKNVVDVYGFWNYGMDSERNEFGMPWSKVKEPLESIRVTVDEMNFEFVFTGETFLNVPYYYRVEDDVIDLMGLCQKVSEDGGSDFLVFGRKISSNSMTVELRGIRRKNTNLLTRNEVNNFIAFRSDIVESSRIGREYRNEPDSSIVVGGFKSNNYVAYPTEYNSEIHFGPYGDTELIDYFPNDIKIRLFGGKYIQEQAEQNNAVFNKFEKTLTVNSGAIFPFWGYHPTKTQYPLIEPFLPLEHLVFDNRSEVAAHIRKRIPFCKIMRKNFSVRNVIHKKTFLEGDDLPDNRPFAYVDSEGDNKGRLYEDVDIYPPYIRGLPLNTEVLRAAMISEFAFWDLYSIYYPDITDSLGCPRVDWVAVKDFCKNTPDNKVPNLESFPIEDHLYSIQPTKLSASELTRDPTNFSIPKSTWTDTLREQKELAIMQPVRNIIYLSVRQYAEEHLGRQFIVCLPRSEIMQRIFEGLPVPTREERPQIEYIIDDLGFWEEIPTEFDGVDDDQDSYEENDYNVNKFSIEEERSIQDKFKAEDGRFRAMVAMDWKPKGNINFNANGVNKALFQDWNPESFRPNKIAKGNPEFVFTECGVTSLIKRPDLALITLDPIEFDPGLGNNVFDDPANYKDHGEEFLATKSGIMKYFWYFYTKDKTLREAIKIVADRGGVGENGLGGMDSNAVKIFKAWANKLYSDRNQYYLHDFSTERIMDLKCVIIPLTSTYVTYGPWYYTYKDARGNIKIDIDDSLVPWNFTTPPDVDPSAGTDLSGAMDRLNEAGEEKLSRTLSALEYLDSATIVVAGFPELGPGQQFGFNNNITGMSVDFSVGSIKTTYNLATYSAKPGTYRKADYDNVTRTRIDTRPTVPTPQNIPLASDLYFPGYRNRFSERHR